MSKKQAATIKLLEQELKSLEREYYALSQDHLRLANDIRPNRAPEIPMTRRTPTLLDSIRTWKNKYPNYSGTIALDFWPIQDWFRFKYYSFTPGKAAQLNLGPVRLDFYQN